MIKNKAKFFILIILLRFILRAEEINEKKEIYNLSEKIKSFTSNILDVNFEENHPTLKVNLISLPKFFKKNINNSFVYLSKSFTLNENFYNNKKIFLELKGIKGKFLIFLNKKLVAEDESFVDYYKVNITEKIDKNENNLIVIFDITNSKNLIYGLNEILIFTSSLISHKIDETPYDKNGIKFSLITQNPKKKSVVIDIETLIINDTTQDKNINLNSFLKKEAKIIEVINTDVKISAKSTFNFKIKKEIKNIDFWSFNSPNIYTYVSILKESNNLVDIQDVKLGFRDLRYNYDELREKYGFFLNEKNIFFTGFNYSFLDDWYFLETKQTFFIEETLSLIKETGANLVNISDSFLSKELVQICDEIGLGVIVPVYNETQLSQLTTYFNTNPSIMFINLKEKLNEIDIEKFKNLNKNFFSKVFFGSNNFDFDQIKNYDWIGTKSFRFLPDNIEKEKAVIEINSLDYNIIKSDSIELYNSIEEASFVKLVTHIFKLCYERSTIAKYPKSRIWSGFIINNFVDYYNDKPYLNGVVTVLRSLKKGYFVYKTIFSNFIKQPFLSIFDIKNDENSKKQEIFIMSNCDEVHLYVDGRLFKVNREPINYYVFKFSGINPLYKNIKAVGYKSLKKACEQHIVIPDKGIKLNIKYKKIKEENEEQFYIVELSIVDSHDNIDFNYKEILELKIIGRSFIITEELNSFDIKEESTINLLVNNGIVKFLVKKLSKKEIRLEFLCSIGKKEIILNE